VGRDVHVWLQDVYDDFVDLKILVLAHSLGSAYKGKVYVRAFIRASVCTYMQGTSIVPCERKMNIWSWTQRKQVGCVKLSGVTIWQLGVRVRRYVYLTGWSYWVINVRHVGTARPHASHSNVWRTVLIKLQQASQPTASKAPLDRPGKTKQK
jgi:hypothetical protein